MRLFRTFRLSVIGLTGIVGGVGGWFVFGDRLPHGLTKCGTNDEGVPAVDGCWILPYAQFRGTIWPTRENASLRAVLWTAVGEEIHALPVPQAVVDAFDAGDGHEVFANIVSEGLLWSEYECQGRRLRLPRWGTPYVFSSFASSTLLMFMTAPSESDSRRAVVGYVLRKW
jgi:hypothetical protein